MSERVDWDGLMRFGLGTMRLPPDAFWSMTPRELAAAAAPWRRDARRGPERSAFEALMRRFPDQDRSDRE